MEQLNADERVDIVDENNVVVETRFRREMRSHRLIHRATYAFVQHSSGYFYVQKRSDIKDYCPGYLDATPGGVVSAGESYAETNTRELEEEMGIVGDSSHLFTFYFEDQRIRCFGDAWHLVYDGPIAMQKEEVSDVYLMSMEEILQHPQITPDSLFAFQEYAKRVGVSETKGPRPDVQFVDDSKGDT